jgi:hypothetical protein
MKVIKPTPITAAMLVSTTATETYSAWNAATAYSCLLYTSDAADDGRGV